VRGLIRAFLDGVARTFKPPKPADWPTKGPPADEHEVVIIREVVAAQNGEVHGDGRGSPWAGGWYDGARKTPAHSGRVGGHIVPRTIIVHTTDMHPSAHNALVKAWTTKPGAGNAAHFLIGRTPEQGIKQFCRITRNANHAGGKGGHGWYRTPAGKLIHPNLVSVGIEIDAAGPLKRRGADFVHPDSGLLVPSQDVYADKRGRYWHRCTEYQREALKQLLRDLQDCLDELPLGTKISPSGDYAKNGVPWAAPLIPSIAGHVSLDPVNKSDPGPQVMAWLGAR
jgi:N-acetyl-anhydromuramyl-L-alanine amidase AmpD